MSSIERAIRRVARIFEDGIVVGKAGQLYNVLVNGRQFPYEGVHASKGCATIVIGDHVRLGFSGSTGFWLKPVILAVLGKGRASTMPPAVTPVLVGLGWAEPQADKSKISSGRIAATYPDYLAGRNTSDGPPTLAGESPFVLISAILVDGDDIFAVQGYTAIWHLKGPLIDVDPLLNPGTAWRWTLAEHKLFPIDLSNSRSQVSMGVGMRFLDLTNHYVTVIPELKQNYGPTAAVGVCNIVTFKLVTGLMQEGVISVIEVPWNGSLLGASMSDDNMLILSCDRMLNSSDLTSGVPADPTHSWVLGLKRTGDAWAQSWSKSVALIIPSGGGTYPVHGTATTYTNVWRALPTPGRYFNYSPPFYGGMFHFTLCAYREDKLLNLTPGDPFAVQLMDVGVSPEGVLDTNVIKEFHPKLEGDFTTLSVTNDFELLLKAQWEAYWAALMVPQELFFKGNPYSPPVFFWPGFQPSSWGTTPIGSPNPGVYWMQAFVWTVTWTWQGTRMSPRHDPFVVNGGWPGVGDRWNGKPIPLPCDINESRDTLSGGSRVARAVGQAHCAVSQGAAYQGAGHCGCKVSLGTASWEAVAYPEVPIALPAASNFTLAINAVSQSTVNYRPGWTNVLFPPDLSLTGISGGDSGTFDDPTGELYQRPAPGGGYVGSVTDTLKYCVPPENHGGPGQEEGVSINLDSGADHHFGWHNPVVASAYRTMIIYSPAPGTYIDVPISSSYSGASWGAPAAMFGFGTPLYHGTIAESLPVFEQVFQLIPVESLGILLVLRTDRDNIKTNYPTVEARKLTDPSVLYWTYNGLMDRSLLPSNIMRSDVLICEAGETMWCLRCLGIQQFLDTVGTPIPTIRPAMKLVQETSRNVLLLSTECVKKQTATTNVPVRVEYRALSITKDDFTVIGTRTSDVNGGSYQWDFRDMDFYNPAVNIPRPNELLAMAIANNTTYLNCLFPYLQVL